MPPNAKSHIVTATSPGDGISRVAVQRTIRPQNTIRPSGTTDASATPRRTCHAPRPDTGFDFAGSAMAAAPAPVRAAEGGGSCLTSRPCDGFHKARIDEGLVVRQGPDLLLGQ